VDKRRCSPSEVALGLLEEALYAQLGKPHPTHFDPLTVTRTTRKLPILALTSYTQMSTIRDRLKSELVETVAVTALYGRKATITHSAWGPATYYQDGVLILENVDSVEALSSDWIKRYSFEIFDERWMEYEGALEYSLVWRLCSSPQS